MSDYEIKINKYKEVNKGCLKGFFNLTILPMGLEIADCKYFVKDSNRWFSFPSKEIKDLKTNETKYISLIRFTEQNAFSKALNQNVLDSLDMFIQGGENESTRNKFTEREVSDSAPFIW